MIYIVIAKMFRGEKSQTEPIYLFIFLEGGWSPRNLISKNKYDT